MKKKLSLKEILRGQMGRLGIKEISPAAGSGEQLSRINIRLIKRMPVSSLKSDVPAIAVITSKVLSQLSMMRETLCRQMPDNISNNHIVFLIIANSSVIPDFLKKCTDAANNNVPIAASKYDEHHLRSLLQGLIREKLQETICVHGVVLEAKGRGILITGASGVGKTTAALKSLTRDDYWVADDIAVVKRNGRKELFACGHKKIRNYLYTEATGIIPVRGLLKSERIKERTKLAAVIEVEKAEIRDIEMIKGEKEILGIKLPCLHVNIPSDGYLNKHLLNKSLRQLSKDN